MPLAPVVEQQRGQVLAVYEVQSGGALAVDLAAGATTITLEDAVDFHELGGECYLGAADNNDSTSQVFAYTAADLTSGVLTLAGPYPSDWPAFVAGDYLWASPVATERRIDVALDGEADQLVTARLPFTISAQVPVGVRPPDSGEWIIVGLTSLGYVVVDFDGEYPATDPSSVQIVDPDTGEVVGELGSDAAFDSVTANTIDSPSVPRRNYQDWLVYVDSAAGDDTNDGTAILPLIDTFERTVSAALGTADTGHAWTTVVNTGNLLDVNAGSARFRSNAGSAVINVRNAFAALDVEVAGVFQMGGTLPTPNAFALGFMARMVGTTEGYWIGLNLLATGQLRIDGNTKIAGVQAGMAGASFSLGTFTAAALAAIEWNVRVQLQLNPEGGTDVRAKAWQVGQAEPDWQWAVNDQAAAGAQFPGAIGLEYRSGSGVATSSILYCRSLTAFCIDSSGQPVDTTIGQVGPMQSVNAALQLAGDWNDGVVRIVLSGTIEEAIRIQGLAGGGQLIIDGATTATLWGTVEIYGAVQRSIRIANIAQLQDTGDNPALTGTITVRASTYVEIVSCNMQANGRAANVQAWDGSLGHVDACSFGGASARCVYVANASVWYFNTNTGAAIEAYRCSAANLYWLGTRPTGSLLPVNQGQIYSPASPTTSGTVTAPANPKKTITQNPNATHTYRPAWGWRDDDDVYQGEWAGSGGLSRGCAFYGTKLQVAGKTADSGKIYVKRASYGGASQGQAIWLASHGYGSQPGGQPNIVDGPINLGSLAWGQAKWFNIPTSWVQKMLNGVVQGVMLYHASSSPYVICPGHKSAGSNYQLKLTYH